MAEDSLGQVRGFQVRYQAVGSHVIQYSGILSSSTFSHYITRLHENTAYDVCVDVFAVDHVSDTDTRAPVKSHLFNASCWLAYCYVVLLFSLFVYIYLSVCNFAVLLFSFLSCRPTQYVRAVIAAATWLFVCFPR